MSEAPSPSLVTGDLDRSELIDLVRINQRLSWQRGKRLPLEDYLDRLPTLRDDAEAVVALILAEATLREEFGERPSAEVYRDRFPEHAASVTRRLQVREALADTFFKTLEHPAAAAVREAGEAVTRVQSPTQAGSSAAASLADGEVPKVPGYEVFGELGRGGMGVVYKAVQVAARRVVALKMILAGGHAGTSERARFKTEAEAVARVPHPGIVQVFEVGEHEGRPFFSLEFCGGGSLAQKLAGTPLPPGEAASVVEALARAVHAAHQKGILHRDLKPSNVLLTEDGTPKVTDFGLAKKLDDVGQTQSGAVMGTPSYMAPEQAEGRSKEVGPASDVYALGAVLYECLTGRPPFRAATVMETLLQVISAEPVPVRGLNRQVPADLETVCLKCLQKSPASRYASAQELADDLQRFRAGEPVRARPVGMLERAARWSWRNPGVTALAAGVLLALVAGTVVSGVFAYQARENALREAASAEQARLNQQAADQRAAEAEKASALLVGVFRAADPLGVNATGFSYGEVGSDRVTVRDLLDRNTLLIVNDATISPEFKARLLAEIGNVYRSHGRYAEARKHLDAALALRLAAPEPDPLAVAECHLGLAWVEAEEGRFTAAEGWVRQALEGRQRHGGGEAGIAEAKWTLGLVLTLMGETASPETERVLLDVVEYRTRTDGEDELSTASARLALAALYLDQGRHAEAFGVVTKAMEVIQRKAPDRNVGKAVGLFQKAVTNAMLWKNHKAAEEQLRECHDLIREAFGEDHVYLVFVLFQLGDTLNRQGNVAKAEETWNSAVAVLRKRHALGNPRAFVLVESLGRLLARAGKKSEAAALVTEAIHATEDNIGKDHPRTADVLVRASKVYSAAGSQEEVATLRRALAIYESSKSPAHLRYAVCLHDLGYYVEQQGQLAEAEGYYRRSWEQIQSHPEFERVLTNTWQLLADYAECLLKQGKHGEETERLMEELGKRVNVFLNPPADGKARWMRLRTAFHHQHGRHDEALAVARSCRKAFAKDADHLVDLAHELVGLISLSRAPKPGSEEERRKIGGAYAEEAVAALADAVAAGYADHKELATTAWLSPLKERDDFRRLLEQVRRKARP